MKTTFEGLTNRWDTTVERIRKLEDMTIKLSQTEMQREEIRKKKSKNCGIVSKNVTYMQLEYQKRRKQMQLKKKNIQISNGENFPKLNEDTKPQIQET